MSTLDDKKINNIKNSLISRCEKCFGICCVALYFSTSEDFPIEKEAGKPCVNLKKDFRCSIHDDLKEKGYKGCMTFDCFGAGQKVSQITFGGMDWIKTPKLAKEMFDVFLIMKKLHEMIWYLTQGLSLEDNSSIHGEISLMIDEIESLTYLKADELIELDFSLYKNRVNELLLKTSEFVRKKFHKGKKIRQRHNKFIGRGLDFIGTDLRKVKLRGEDLSCAYFIASDLRGIDFSGSDFIGADLRDADIRGANLENSIFLTQSQINGARGNSTTKLPFSINYPSHWEEN